MKNNSINCTIIGFGNLGSAVCEQLPPDFNLIGIFSRRKSDRTIPLDEIKNYANQIDIAFFCGGSNTDAPELVPILNELGISTVDSYDNHEKIGEYQRSIGFAQAKNRSTVAIIGAGWDPGYLSILRIYNRAILPNATHKTTYGPGVSMGHTNAIKTIPNVIDAQQITYPNKRVCYVVADKKHHKNIKNQILNMDGYFKGQRIIVKFKRFTPSQHHAGKLTSSSLTANITTQITMDSNPTFTARCMIAFARVGYKMKTLGNTGAFTIDQIPPSLLLNDEQRLNEI